MKWLLKSRLLALTFVHINVFNFLIGILLGCVSGASPVFARVATTIYVPDDYSTIQKAVDSASPGDTIIVKVGTYSESVLVNKSLTLKGKETPLISGVTHSVITVTADACTIDGFEVTGGGCGGNDAGIEVRSDRNLIINNIVRNNYGGIALYDCSHNTLISNLVYDNHWYGIGLSSSCNNTLSNNTVRDNTNIGVKLYYSSNNNIVSGNIVSGSNVFGIELWKSSFNSLYQNNLIDNAQNARDCYGDNSWDNGSKGNYWSDYMGVDANGDGIGDTPYAIEGDIDNYPLMEPFENYWIVDFNQSPIALLDYSPKEPKAGEWITFDASQSYDRDGKIEFYEWDLNNNGIYEEFTIFPVAKFQWNKAGTYEVALRVIDNNGARSEKIIQTVVVKKSFWDKVEDFFEDVWPWGKKVKKIEDEELSIIKKELKVDEWLPTTQFYWSNNYDLKIALNQEIDSENVPALTYGIYILNGIREKEMIEDVLSQNYKYKATEYFNKWLDLNTGWSAVAKTIEEKIFTGLIGEVGPIGGTLLSLSLASAKAGEVVVPLGEVILYNTLWSYFENRQSGNIHAEAWRNAHSGPWSGNYFINNQKVEEHFIHLWETYEEFLSNNPPPYLKEELIRKKLQDAFLSALKKYKLPIRHILTLKSPGELRVYDSQGRITGLAKGEVREEIPNSIYDEENKVATIFFPTDSYHYEVVGTEEGNYGLEMISVEDNETTTFTATDIPTSTNAIHEYTIDWQALSKGEKGVIVQMDYDGDGTPEQTFTSGDIFTVDEELSVKDLEKETDIPGTFALFQNYPNPFNPTTVITFNLPENSYVTLTVFNTLGQKLATLVDETREAGSYGTTWDAIGFPSGVYFYRMAAEGFIETRKMLLMR